MMIILNEGETVTSATVNGFEWKIYPHDIYHDADGRRIVNIMGNKPSKQKEPFDTRGLRIASSSGGAVIDADSIIVGA